MGHVVRNPARCIALDVENHPDTLDPLARQLGLAGLLPPVLGLLAVAVQPDLRWIVLAASFAYAAFIFSFLGGIWWGLAIMRARPPRWILLAAIAPSLLSLALFMPWAFGWDWPQPAMVVLAGLILASPLVDLGIGRSVRLPGGWMRLRWQLSVGLGALTFGASLL